MPSNRRHDAKRDIAEPAIVDALERYGCIVYRELPVDLLVRVKRDPPGVFRCLEVKTPRRTGNFSKDLRQLKQMEFMQVTGTPYVTTVEQALEAVGVNERSRNWVACPLVSVRPETCTCEGWIEGQWRTVCDHYSHDGGSDTNCARCEHDEKCHQLPPLTLPPRMTSP